MEYYKIYKATFTSKEWLKEMEKIIQHYQESNKYFSANVANVLIEEKNTKRLLKYIQAYCSARNIETYFSHFHIKYPTETIQLFEQAIHQYAEANTGRNHYEYLATLFIKMSKVAGGATLAKLIINHFKIQYKTRRAMVDVLNKIKL